MANDDGCRDYARLERLANNDKDVECTTNELVWLVNIVYRSVCTECVTVCLSGEINAETF